MELREFINTTLVEIVGGILDAREAVGDLDAGAGVATDFTANESRSRIRVVSFDVALTSNDTEEKKKGIGVFLGGIGLGGKAETQASTRSHTRVSFSVPIVLADATPREKLSELQTSKRG